MLRDCFRCYWFVDEQNRFRVEHIQYFRNGGSYSVSPVVGIDLTTQQVSRNGKAWAFARDQFKFDKPTMAARYQFGWMDDVTQLFEGFPIDIVSKYVNPDNIEQIDVSKFTSDIDYILLNPGAVSKDGFVLLAATKVNDAIIDNPGNFQIYNGCPNVELNINRELMPPGQINLLLTVVSKTSENVNLRCTCYKNGQSLGYFAWGSQYLPNAGETRNYVIGTQYNDADKLVFSYRTGDGNITMNIRIVPVDSFELPYINFPIDNNDHVLQNAYVAFYFLQRYYAFDMPAPHYAINGVQMYAQGIKKLKNQTLRFPVLNDPDLVQLVKTNLGNGTIEKLSVNLSSRNANATLKYDTE